MKKLLSLLMALAMLLGCLAFAEEVGYTGTWVLTGMEMMGLRMGFTQLEASGASMTMVLDADGAVALITADAEEKGTWVVTETGIAITDTLGETMDLVYQDEMLVMTVAELEGTVMMFTREGAAPAIAENAAPVAQANVAPETFEGQWLMTKISMMGMELPTDQLGMYMAFVLADGAGIMGTNESEDGSIVTGEIVYTVAEEEGVGTALSIYPALEEGAEAEEPLVLYMSQNGELFYSEEGTAIIFEKQVEEPAAE